jgi:hypothetical protein
VASVVREPTHELDAVHAAVLAETNKENRIRQAVQQLARNWEGRIELRLGRAHGPLRLRRHLAAPHLTTDHRPR